MVFESSGSERFDEAETLLINRKKAIKDGKQPEVKKIAITRSGNFLTRTSYGSMEDRDQLR